VKINSTQVSIGAVSVAIGIMLSVQFSANLQSSSYIPFKQWSKQAAFMENLQKQNDKLLNETVSLRNQLALESSDEQSKGFNENLAKVNIAAGFTPVIGPGIVISLDDNPDPLQVGDNPEDYIVHDYNLLFVVNQLKSSGAEAISINNERVIASSEVRCAGPTILVNTTRVSPPFEIKVIGNPEVMESSMRATGGELYTLGARGMKIRIQKAGKVEIPAFSGILKYHYAQSNI